jgi:hypothetical protein
MDRQREGITMSSPMLAEQLAQALRQAGVAGVYGLVGESHDPIVDAIRRTDGIEWVYVGEEEAEALAARKQTAQPTTNDAHDELTVEQASRLAVTAVTADLEYWARTAASGDGRVGVNDLIRILDVIRVDSTPEL